MLAYNEVSVLAAAEMGLMKGEAEAAADFVERLSGTVVSAAGGVPVLDSADDEVALGVDDLGMKDELARGEAEPLAGIFVISTRSTDEGRSLLSTLAAALLPGLFRSMVKPAGMAGGVESLEELETLAAREA